MKFNRPMIACINNKKVTIYSFDTINKMMDNPLSVKGENLVFKTTKEISTYLHNIIKNKYDVNLKVSVGSPEHYILDVNLSLSYKCSMEIDKMEDTYLIERCANNQE